MFKFPSHLLHLLDVREPAARANWRSMSPAQLQKFQSEVDGAQQTWKHHKTTLKRFIFAMTAVVFVTSLVSGWVGYSQGDPKALQSAPFYAMGLGFLGLAGFIALGMVDNTKGESLRQLSMFLAPLSRPDYAHACVTALRLVKEIPAAEAYRQAVLANGRELVFGDIRVMEELRYAAQQEAAQRDYRELHRPAPASAL